MNICYPVETEQGSNNVLHGHFRLAPRFLVFNTKTDEAMSVENQLGKDTHDISVPLASLNEMVIDAAVVGGINRCDLKKINKQGIKVFRAAGPTIDENTKALMEGNLIELTQGNIHRGRHCL